MSAPKESITVIPAPPGRSISKESCWEDYDGDWHWRFTTTGGVRISSQDSCSYSGFKTRAAAEENMAQGQRVWRGLYEDVAQPVSE